MFKKFIGEFKTFALRGNVMNLAVGVIIGSSFQGVVTSLTQNILSPIIGLFTRQNFDSLDLSIFGVNLKYGAFITSAINFFIMAFVVFLLVTGMNKLLSLGERKKKAQQQQPPAPPPAPDRLCPYCKTAIHPEAVRCHACTSVLVHNRKKHGRIQPAVKN